MDGRVSDSSRPRGFSGRDASVSRNERADTPRRGCTVSDGRILWFLHLKNERDVSSGVLWTS